MQCIYHYRSPVGDIAIKSDGDALLGLWFDGQRFQASEQKNISPVVEETEKWLDSYFRGKDPEPNKSKFLFPCGRWLDRSFGEVYEHYCGAI